MIIDKAKFIHFVGIGGIGTSSLAQILREKGKIISGSDLVKTEITESLRLKKIKISIGHSEKNVNKKHQLIIYSPAIPDTNPEMKKAKNLKIKCLSYPQALGELTKKHFTIAVAGAHGKSTTTAMISLIAANAKLDPTVVIGTKLKEFKNQNYRVGKSDLLIIEACEYKRSFLNFEPDILVITNIEADHLDYYKNIQDYKKAFKQLIGKIKKNGTVIIDEDDRFSSQAVRVTPKASNLKVKRISGKSKEKINIRPGIHGKFNLKNASLAAATAVELKVPIEKIKKSLKNYHGSWRRMEYKKTKFPHTIFIDDYGHHPTEVRSTLSAIRETHPEAKILCVYQPHQYSRTKIFLEEFGKSFYAVNEIIIPDIYDARDYGKGLKVISVDELVKVIKKHHSCVQNGISMEKTAQYIKKNHKKFDVIVTMGAGDIGEIYKLF
ncbi:UDP-N-acetylmuramate--L-alanine ligase, partial [Candidatus Peregrinibacteria bacterium RIFCSPLOWO2_01_FULL_39_12]